MRSRLQEYIRIKKSLWVMFFSIIHLFNLIKRFNNIINKWPSINTFIYTILQRNYSNPIQITVSLLNHLVSIFLFLTFWRLWSVFNICSPRIPNQISQNIYNSSLHFQFKNKLIIIWRAIKNADVNLVFQKVLISN